MLRRMALSGVALLGLSAPALPQAMNFYVTQVIEMPTGFCPSGSLPANGQLLATSTYPLLFTFLGYSYGGNGGTLFALPKLAAPKSANGHPMTMCIVTNGIIPLRP